MKEGLKILERMYWGGSENFDFGGGIKFSSGGEGSQRFFGKMETTTLL